jgi:hypothetical protein
VAKPQTPSWAQAPARHDYPAATSFLGLVATAAEAEVLTALLTEAPTVHHKAKDILRAAGLPLLPTDDPSVAKDLKRVRKRTPLAPVLLVRGDLTTGIALTIADGYHRVCASYHLSEDLDIPCRIAALPAISV